MVQLSDGELAEVRGQLADYAPAQSALSLLERRDGELDVSIEMMLRKRLGPQPTFSGDSAGDEKSLWAVTKRVLREELCGDEGFRGKIAEYSKEGSAPFLVGAITYVATQMTLPIPVDPGIATLVVLYVAKVGLNVFCEYTEPEDSA